MAEVAVEPWPDSEPTVRSVEQENVPEEEARQQQAANVNVIVIETSGLELKAKRRENQSRKVKDIKKSYAEDDGIKTKSKVERKPKPDKATQDLLKKIRKLEAAGKVASTEGLDVEQKTPKKPRLKKQPSNGTPKAKKPKSAPINPQPDKDSEELLAKIEEMRQKRSTDRLELPKAICYTCGDHFDSDQSLAIHIRESHVLEIESKDREKTANKSIEDLRPFVCSICLSRFETELILDDHQTKKHKMTSKIRKTQSKYSLVKDRMMVTCQYCDQKLAGSIRSVVSRFVTFFNLLHAA